MMQSVGSLEVDATIPNLRVIAGFLQSVGNHLELTEKTMFDIDLAVEEATTNIVMHGYEDRDTGKIRVDVSMSGDELYLYIAIRDWGTTYDPTGRVYDYDASIDVRSQGGMGIHFIKNLMDDVTYTPPSADGGGNTLTLKKELKRRRKGSQLPSAMRELNAMLRVSQSLMTNTDSNALLDLIVESLAQIMDAERAILYLLDKERDTLVMRALAPRAEVDQGLDLRVPVGEGSVGYVADTGQVLNVVDVQSQLRFEPEYDSITGFTTQCLLAVPIFNGQHDIIGVVQLMNKSDGAFSSRDERLLTAMTAQAAINLELSRLYEQEIEQRLIQQELDTASRIQKGFLPQNMPDAPEWDIHAVWEPVRNVAGDFYDFYRLPNSGLGVTIADVSGKGIPASLFMALTVTVLRFAVGLDLSPSKVLSRANLSILSDQSSRLFVTAMLLYIQRDTGEIHFANAGHNPALLYRAETGEIEYVTSQGVAMGVFKLASYESARFTMQPDDVLVLYTDGITEMINDEEDEFGEDRLEEVVQKTAHLSSEAISRHIIEAVAAFCGNQAIFDDQTMVVIKRLPKAE